MGAGKLFGWEIGKIISSNWEPAVIMVLPPGAFITIGVLMAAINYAKKNDK